MKLSFLCFVSELFLFLYTKLMMNGFFTNYVMFLYIVDVCHSLLGLFLYIVDVL